MTFPNDLPEKQRPSEVTELREQQSVHAELPPAIQGLALEEALCSPCQLCPWIRRSSCMTPKGQKNYTALKLYIGVGGGNCS